jgi:hypothetical protein
VLDVLIGRMKSFSCIRLGSHKKSATDARAFFSPLQPIFSRSADQSPSQSSLVPRSAWTVPVSSTRGSLTWGQDGTEPNAIVPDAGPAVEAAR